MSEEQVAKPYNEDDFVNRTAERCDRWICKLEGAEIVGDLMGSFPSTGPFAKKGDVFYQFKLRKPCQVMEGTGKDRMEAVAEPGQLVNIDDCKALEPLEALAADTSNHLVRLKFVEKKPLQGGNTFWDIHVGSQVV